MRRILLCAWMALALVSQAGGVQARSVIDYRQLLAYIENGQTEPLQASLKGHVKEDIHLPARSILMAAAIEQGQVAAVKALLDWGMDANRPLLLSQNGEPLEVTPLVYAISNKASLAVVRQLTACGADVNKPNGDLLPLNFALSMRRYDLAEHLLDKGARAAGADGPTGMTPLMELAMSAQDTEPALLARLTRRLVAGGADANAKTKHDATALSFAVLGGSPAMTRILLELGADPNVKNRRGETLLAVARRRHRDDIAAILDQFGARP